MTATATAAVVGDLIAHNLLPFFHMQVLDTKECLTDWARPEPHLAYKIVDFEGNEDWLCAHDVHKVSGGQS